MFPLLWFKRQQQATLFYRWRQLAETEGVGLITPLARATRGRGLPSHGKMARLGVPVSGRVRKLHAVEDQSAPFLKRERASLEGSFHQMGLLSPEELNVPVHFQFTSHED